MGEPTGCTRRRITNQGGGARGSQYQRKPTTAGRGGSRRVAVSRLRGSRRPPPSRDPPMVITMASLGNRGKGGCDEVRETRCCHVDWPPPLTKPRLPEDQAGAGQGQPRHKSRGGRACFQSARPARPSRFPQPTPQKVRLNERSGRAPCGRAAWPRTCWTGTEKEA